MSCRLCDGTDHNRRTCENTPDELKPRPPDPTSPGVAFIVVETTIDETGATLVTDDVWTAIKPTGRVLDGYYEWTMRNGVREQLAFPALHPFLRRPGLLTS